MGVAMLIFQITPSSETPLFVALRHGHYDIANLLLKNGANVDGDCRARFSPLFQAVPQRRSKFVEQLYLQGADLNLLDADGDPAICQAAYQGDMDIVKLLLKSTTVNLKGALGRPCWRFKWLAIPKSRIS